MQCRRGVGLLTGGVLLALAACSREPQPESTPTTAGAIETPQPGDPPAQTPPADSGLSIKRGIAVLAKGQTTFQPCGQSAKLWVVDQTENLLAQTFATELRAGDVKLYVEAYGERASVPEDAAAAVRGYAGVFILEEVLYAGIDAADRGCAAPTPKYIVAAHGNEPSWAVQVTESQMVWRQPDPSKAVVLTATPAQDAEGAVRYQASGDGHELELMLDAQPCRDSMSGDFYAYAARAVFDGEEFKGCARVGQ